jgi:hypothetical protein
MSGEDFSAPVPAPEPPPVAETAADSAGSGDAIRVLVVCVLAWAIPGLGHIASGRIGRGLVFALVVLALFVGGIGLHGKVYRPETGEPLTYLAAVGAAGVGLPYVVAHAMGLGFGDIRTQSFEYGNTFTLVAGLLNLLIVLDAYDVASGRR